MFSNKIFFKSLVLTYFGYTFGGIGNMLFILISGFFLIEKEFIDVKKQIIKLLKSLLFVTIVLTLLSAYFVRGDISRINWVDISCFNNQWWFIGFYISIIVLAQLFINRRIKKLNKNQYLIILLVLFSIVSLSFIRKIICGLSEGLDVLIFGIFAYLLGGYIRIYNPFDKVRSYVIVLSIIGIYILMAISYYNFAMGNIHQAVINQQTDFVQIEYNFYGNHIWNGMFIAVALFELFRRIKISNCIVINALAGSTFMMYLIHENGLVWGWLVKFRWNHMLYENEYLKFCAYILCLICAYMIIGFVANYICVFLGWIYSRFFRNYIIKGE